MSQLFNYKSLSISLNKEQKCCHVSLLNNNENFDSPTLLNELELFFDWLTNKVEISSVLIETQSSDFKVLPKSLLNKLNIDQLSKHLQLCQRLSWVQVMLPQTIIWNYTGPTDYHAFELSSGADLITCNPSFTTSFNVLSMGLTPSSSGISIQSKSTGPKIYKSYILRNKCASAAELQSLGLISFINFGDELKTALTEISKQSSIARIQFKRSSNNELIKDMDESMTAELSFARATLAVGDWQRWSSDREFGNPREYSKTIRNVPTRSQVANA